MKIGANYLGNNECEFVVWAINPQSISVKITEPFEKIIPMKKEDLQAQSGIAVPGYWRAKASGIPAGARYFYRINNSDDRPDPASHYQPYDVHSVTEVINHAAFKWNDNNWKGKGLEDLIIYELHTGTFTNEGTFESAIDKLDYLAELGITAIEIMPVSQFPGSRNWGYDGCYPYAPQNSYGGPEGLKKLVNAAHQKQLAVILDVVYNHFGPEGNYAPVYSPYFTSRYRTPWGNAINFDDEYCDGVRNFFIENAKHWFTNYHVDGLRLDATDTIFDISPKHFLQELAEETEKISIDAGIKKFLIAENDLNDVKIVKPVLEGGYGIDAQWSDNFHHSIHALLTNEKDGYYIDFGNTSDLIDSLKKTFLYSGQYSVFRKKRFGTNPSGRPTTQFVVCLQNHDQVGNRAFGERLSKLVPFEALKAAAGILLLSPYIPLLFMGEEYGEDNPFLYFISHTDENLVEAVQEGRKEEFRSFAWKGKLPDPFGESTFYQSKLDWDKTNEGKHRMLLEFYRHLISLRKRLPALKSFDRNNFDVKGTDADRVIEFSRWHKSEKVFSVFNFNDETVTTSINFPEGNWRKILDSAFYASPGRDESAPLKVIGKPQNLTLKGFSFLLYEMEK